MRYKEYKKVDIPWLEEVPSHWEVVFLKNISEIYTGNSIPDDEKKNYTDKANSRPYISTKDITRDNNLVDYNNGLFIKVDNHKFRIAGKNSTLVCIEGGSGGEKVAYLTEEVSFVNKLCCIKSTKNSINDKYIYYTIQSSLFKDQYSMSISGDRNGVSLQKLGYFQNTIPPREEQEQIARFLDWKINYIDGIIKSKNKTLDKIIFMKKSFITKMITKGYSNIDVMPDNINIVRLKNLCNKIIDGTHFTPEYQKEGIPFLRVTDISQLRYNEDIDLSKVKRISKEEHYNLTKRCSPKRGDVLVSKNGSIGIPTIVNWDWDFSIFVSLCLLKLTNEVIPEWVYFYFLSSLVEIEIAKGGKKGTIVNLHLEKIKEFQIPLPSLEEQKEIVDIINKKIIKLDELKLNIEKQINNLKQLKQSIISDAVTGKIDIRNIDIPDYGKVNLMEEDIDLEESFNEEV